MRVLIALVLFGTAAQGASAPAGARPLGTVYPTRSVYLSPPPSTRPLGGVPLPSPAPVRRKTPRVAPTYVGPVYYIPNAFDSYPDLSSYPPPTPAPNQATQPLAANQYFASKDSGVPDMANPADMRQPGDAPDEETLGSVLKPGDLLDPTPSYYLIRYKDRSTFSALTYWLEGDTLHYVTTQNTHNQASLDLIDIDQTYKLNADRSVPFSIPGR